MLTDEELAQIRALAEKAMPGPYVAQDDRGWHTPCIGRITSDGYTLMRGLTCTLGKYEREMEQADFWASVWPQRVVAMIDEITQRRAAEVNEGKS